jgi:hypothetical protein
MNYLQHRISSGIIAIVAAWVCWISFTQKPAEAFLFPRIIAAFFLILAVWTFIKAILGRSRIGNGLSMNAAKNMAPGVLIAGIHIFWAAKTLGFYAASTIAFFLLLSVYDPAPNNKPKTWIKRAVITIGFIAIMYALFAIVLKVYTPRGLFI